MRLALLIFAFMAAPVFANDAIDEPEKPTPPSQPTYEKPTFDPPETPPETPRTPQRPRDEDNDKPREVRSTTKPAPVSCPKVKCVTDENGHRRAMFTADVQPDMYYLGRNFCATAPKDIEVTACCLAKPDDTYQILYNVKVSKKAHWKAKQFCTCVLELD